jgi:hypothetical protein
MSFFADLPNVRNPIEELVIERDPREPHILMVRHPDTRLIIGTTTWPSAVSLAEKAPFTSLCCYAVTGQTLVAFGPGDAPGAHIGRSGQMPVRTRRHRRTPPLDTPKALTVITLEGGGFLLQEAAALERRLHEVAASSTHLVVSQPPSDPGLSPTVLARAERWVDVLRWVLPILRCDILQEARDRPSEGIVADARCNAAPNAMAAPPEAGWTTRIPKRILTNPGGKRYRLQLGDVTATLREVNGWHVVEPGSTARALAPGYIQQGVRAKRETLRAEGVFQPIAGRDDLWMVARPLTLPSLTNAARTLLGSNTRWRVWREIA